MSGRLDSNQRPPEPHFPGPERFQPPNVTNASLLETYRFHSSHSLRRSQARINDFSTVSRRAMSSRKAVSDRAVIVPNTSPKNAGSSRVRSVTRVTTPRLPPPPPFRPQKRSGFVQALAMRATPSAVTTSASSNPAAARPYFFEKLPKPPL